MAQNITVVDTNSQSSTILENCEAKTLGELKTILSAKGVNYTNCAFYEASNKVELKADDATIPAAKTAKGLMFMLTMSSKHITSGAISRAEAVAFIKSNNLADTFKKENNGKNWTNASTAVLVSFVENHAPQSPASEETPSSQAEPQESVNPLVVAMLYVAEKLNCKADVENILTTGKLPNPGTFTQSEIDKMLAEAKKLYK